MAQRQSGYVRKPFELYSTPRWVTQALIPHLPFSLEPQGIWEPAAGNGQMAEVLLHAGYNVTISDIRDGLDFFTCTEPPAGNPINGIVTNPPFDRGQEFVEHALRLMEPVQGFVVMLLRIDWDSAKTRSHLFRYCRAWSKKIVLTKRIVWIEPPAGSKGKGPSENHCFCLWDHRHKGPPTISYAP